MIELNHKTKEVDIKIKYTTVLGAKPKIEIVGEADLSHHLIEELFGLIDRLSRMENCGHQSKEWRDK